MDAEKDTFKILVATDNHIGYMEKDPVRFSDSLDSFEEILKVAQDQQVDFILLGGDLFHDNKPSRQVLHRTLELLRHYCMGSRPCPIEFTSDPTINFRHSKFPSVNYEDPNYNISMPVFIIHGNHDDPTGDGNLSAMDILSVTNLVNYFGKATDIEDIEISPLLLKKGIARLALYGLGSCRDERLHRLFRKGKVKFLRPSEEEGEWFNVLVLHQNRAKHGATNYIPASFIPGFFDLVIWGHEHECLIDPEFVSTEDLGEDDEEKGVYISQPGSSVATSLSDGEQRPKHIGVLYVKSDCTFKIDPIKLTTVRPFIIESTRLQDTGINVSDDKAVFSFLTGKVKSMVEKVKSENVNSNKKPLVRLKVDYNGGYSSFSLARFGQQFQESVANPSNILLWFRHRDTTKLSKKKNEDFSSDLERFENSEVHVAALVEEELKKEQLDIISEKTLVEALTDFVEKEENDALSECVKFCLEESQAHLKAISASSTCSSENISDIIHEKRVELHKIQETKAMESLHQSRSSRRANLDSFADERNHSDSDDDSDTPKPKPTTTRGRGRRGRVARAGKTTTSTRGRGSKSRGRGSKASTSAAAAASPALSFVQTGASTSRSRLPGKRSVKYDSESGSDEDIFSLHPAKKARNSSKSARPINEEPIDLTQSDENSGSEVTGPSQDSSNPFSAFSGRFSSRNKKKK